MGVKAGCTPRDDVLHGELDDAIFAASFGKLVRNEGPDIYREPDQFFRNTHPTASLSKLCRDTFARLASSVEGGAILRLSTGFGGGKTHALMTLWHLAQNVGDPEASCYLPPAGRQACGWWASMRRVLAIRSLPATVTQKRAVWLLNWLSSWADTAP